MAADDFRVDFRGARGSNTGDEFHELWAIRHALSMLDPHSSLSSIMLEGVKSGNEDGNFWDGVDCTLLYCGDSLAEAKHVEIQQLKYSAANPTKKWTVARACAGRGGTGSASLIHRLGQAFHALRQIRKDKKLESIKVKLVTNQPISPELLRVIFEAREDVPETYAVPWKTGDSKLHRLVSASGLSPSEFRSFAFVFDCVTSANVGSRFSMEDGILTTIATFQDVEFQTTFLQLRNFVRKRMLPEAAGEQITKQNILIQFGVSDESALFPCPPAMKPVSGLVSRDESERIVETMKQGTQRICFHGGAGVGKTTALQEINSSLPANSHMIVFDCYGAGSYLDASKLRHRPRDAFTQLSNELAERLRIPLFLQRSESIDYARAFCRRLEIAAETLKLVSPDAFLVIAVDAADNSISAANAFYGNDTCFVPELMSFHQLPENVRIIVSARTGRLDELSPPSAYVRIELSGFTKDETTQNVNRFWNAPANWIDVFHELSNGIPRVQDYAFEWAREKYEKAMDVLLPEGKDLDQIFDESFAFALKKSGNSDLVQNVCAALIVLPRPIPITELAYLLQLPVSQVLDICADLAPGIRMQGNNISFSDEDFEDFVRRKGIDEEQNLQVLAAERCLSQAECNTYAARNVAHLLFVSGRHQELLEFVEKEPEPNSEAVPDPVQRREINDER